MDFRPVQDLREVNKWVSDIHPMVPNPYTLLSGLSLDCVWYTVLDLKDAFFSLPVAPQSQEIFAFEWADEGGQTVRQLLDLPPIGIQKLTNAVQRGLGWRPP